jgi:KaiC/GvpD/RAD55 family RecA-like ATPase
MLFQKATKKQSRLRLALIGPSGSGKTYSALSMAAHLVPGGRVAVIDTERGSASKYADRFEFDVLELESFAPAKYVEGIQAAGTAGYDVVVVDSLSHAWTGTDGALAMVDKISKRSTSGSSFNAWRDVTPEHNKMVEAILRSPAHVIVTMRVKTEYVLERDDRTGKTVPKKVGLAPVQRDGLEYEFDVVGDINAGHGLTITKTRCPALADQYIELPGEQIANTLRAWLSDGVSAPEPARQAPEDPDAGLKDRLNNPAIRGLFDALGAPEAKRLTTLRKYASDDKLIEILQGKVREAGLSLPEAT